MPAPLHHCAVTLPQCYAVALPGCYALHCLNAYAIASMRYNHASMPMPLHCLDAMPMLLRCYARVMRGYAMPCHAVASLRRYVAYAQAPMNSPYIVSLLTYLLT